MLSDLYLIETFYGPTQMGLYLEDVMGRYGRMAMVQALRAGEITVRRLYIGPARGRHVVMLTPQGRSRI